MNKTAFLKSCLIMILMVMVIPSWAQSGLKTRKVTIFTDANSYVQKSGTVIADKGVYELRGDELPPARYGTLEITDVDKTIKSITSSLKPVESVNSYFFNSLFDLLSQNKGIRLNIQTASRTISGELLQVFSDYILVKADKVIMLKTADILSFTFDSEPVMQKLYVPAKPIIQTDNNSWNDYSQNTALTIHFATDGKKELNLRYLQKGFFWSPMYTLRLLNEKKAELSLQAEIINDAEDLDGVDISLALGKPDFKFSTYLTDLLDYNHILNPFFEPRNPSYSVNDGFVLGLSNLTKERNINDSNKEEDEMQHDFYFHRLHGVSLKKNSRGLFKILRTEVPYRHIYECDLIDLDYQNGSYNRNEKGTENIVYHSVLIDNNTDILLGKGSILVVEGSEETEFPLAQSVLDYIPARSEGLIKLTENHEIEINHREQIVSRSPDKIEFWGRNYYSTTIEGSVKIKNLKTEGIEIFIRSMINGELINRGIKGEIVFQKQTVNSPNYKSKIQWNLHVKAGEEQEIKYQYKVLAN